MPPTTAATAAAGAPGYPGSAPPATIAANPATAIGLIRLGTGSPRGSRSGSPVMSQILRAGRPASQNRAPGGHGGEHHGQHDQSHQRPGGRAQAQPRPADRVGEQRER